MYLARVVACSWSSMRPLLSIASTPTARRLQNSPHCREVTCSTLTAVLHTLHCLVTRWRWQGPAEDGDLVRRTAPTTAVTTINTPMARVEMTRTGIMDTGDTWGLTDICSSVQM